jgi:hypothetical protein
MLHYNIILNNNNFSHINDEQLPTSRVLSVPVWLDPKQQDVAAAGNSSLLASIFLAQEVCSHLAMLPVHASELSTMPAKFNTHQVQ